MKQKWLVFAHSLSVAVTKGGSLTKKRKHITKVINNTNVCKSTYTSAHLLCNQVVAV